MLQIHDLIFRLTSLLGVSLTVSAVHGEDLRCTLTITSQLPDRNIPFDPQIDFESLIAESGHPGVLDPDSIKVINAANGREVPVAVTEDLSYSDRGRVEWVIEEPDHLKYEIRFRVTPARVERIPAKFTPPIGTGDLLRWNAGVPRAVNLLYLSRLADVTGDGLADLVGCWNYAHRPGSPWDGIVVYPRIGDAQHWEFGDLVRLRHVTPQEPDLFRHFSSTYMNADFADLNHDGLPDVVYSPMRGDTLSFYLNSGKRDAGGLPVFTGVSEIRRPENAWEAVRAVDLNGDHAVDVVVGDYYIRNRNSSGWPFQPDTPVVLDAGRRASFIDLDDDGLMDSVCMAPSDKPGPAHPPRLAWRRNTGGDPPRFEKAALLEDIDVTWCSDVAAVKHAETSGLLVQHDVFQKVSFFECLPYQGSQPRFRRSGLAQSVSAVMSLSDQAWPCLCDWNGDGLIDLLVGGGYGWPRIVINQGTRERAAFAEPQLILSEGKPIRILMSDVYPGCEEYRHNMGYPFPVFADWSGDGLPDLMLPNCSNRIFWYENTGTRAKPEFGPRQQLNPQGWEDSPEKRRATGEILMSRWEGELEPGQPFFWRTGAAFADFNSDGLMDMVTHDGETRKATLFEQFQDADGIRRLKKSEPLRLTDGRMIDDAIVGRTSHWTESFRAADWDSDGLTDVVYSCAGANARGSIYLLRNAGTPAAPVFEPPRVLCCYGDPIYVTAHGPHPWVGDFDGDGKPDLVACVEWSVYPFYRHAAIEMTRRPEFTISAPQAMRHPSQ